MKVGHVLLGLGVTSSIIGLVLIILGNIPPWSKDNFVYVMGIMILLLSIPICCLGILAYWKGKEVLGLGVASVVLGFVLIVLGNIPPWSKDNFVYVIGVMTLFFGVLVCCFGVVAYWRRRQEESRPTS